MERASQDMAVALLVTLNTEDCKAGDGYETMDLVG